MRLYNIQDIKVGNYITYICQKDDDIFRSFVQVQEIQEQQDKKPVRFIGKKIKPDAGSIYIDNLFECKSDSAYETHQDLQTAFPEEFI